MPKPTKAEMIKELLCLSDYDYAMATHGDGALIHSDIAALVCMSDGDDRCLKELGDQALAPFDVGTLAAAVIGQENAREAAAALGYGECFDELFANQKLAFEEHF